MGWPLALNCLKRSGENKVPKYSGEFWRITETPDITYRDLYLYCAQHTLGSHARVVNAAHFGNLYHTGPAEFIKK